MPFKSGEIVMCTLSDTLVKIKCGPFTSTANETSYLVEWTEGPDKGMCSVVWSSDLEPHKFKAGDRVRSWVSPDQGCRVEAGPFPGAFGHFYVLVLESGNCVTEQADYLRPYV